MNKLPGTELKRTGLEITERVSLCEIWLRHHDRSTFADVLGFDGQDARTSGPVSAMFFQPFVHVLEGSSGSRNCVVLQCADATNSSPH